MLFLEIVKVIAKKIANLTTLKIIYGNGKDLDFLDSTKHCGKYVLLYAFNNLLWKLFSIISASLFVTAVWYSLLSMFHKVLSYNSFSWSRWSTNIFLRLLYILLPFRPNDIYSFCIFILDFSLLNYLYSDFLLLVQWE